MKRKIAPRKEEEEAEQEQQFSNFKDRDERLAVKNCNLQNPQIN